MAFIARPPNTPYRGISKLVGSRFSSWTGWYEGSIPLAEEPYARWLAGGYRDVIGG